jgi:hypothetical protein
MEGLEEMATVLVCDDEGSRATGIARRLRRRLEKSSEFEIRSLSPADFMDAVAGLEERQLRARDTVDPSSLDEHYSDSTLGHPFDTADILFVDYDLVRLSSAGAESGERVSYLARCYSRCGNIIAYNQFSYHASFDLTLRGHIRSFADVNISADVASNGGLWTDEHTGFRPWSWPILPAAYRQLNQRAEYVANHLDEPLLSTLGFDNDRIYGLLTREQLELLSRNKDPRHATFEEFVQDSPIGLRPRDKALGRIGTARVAAARIGKWLERIVLPDQNILVDAPHLISRFPSLIGEPYTEAHWNPACRLTVLPSELGLDYVQLQPHEFSAKDWLSRPAWFWPNVAADDGIVEVRDPWSPRPDQLVFCEDISRFRHRNTATEFDADVAPEFSRRFLARVKNVDYVPTVRFLL